MPRLFHQLNWGLSAQDVIKSKQLIFGSLPQNQQSHRDKVTWRHNVVIKPYSMQQHEMQCRFTADLVLNKCLLVAVVKPNTYCKSNLCCQLFLNHCTIHTVSYCFCLVPSKYFTVVPTETRTQHDVGAQWVSISVAWTFWQVFGIIF